MLWIYDSCLLVAEITFTEEKFLRILHDLVLYMYGLTCIWKLFGACIWAIPFNKLVSCFPKTQ
jgi:hypothetical protein